MLKMEGKMTRFVERRRSVSCSSLSTISEVGDDLGDLTCEATRRNYPALQNDRRQTSILPPGRDPKKEFLLLTEKESMSMRRNIVRGDRTRNENISEKGTIIEKRQPAGSLRHSRSENISNNIEKSACGDPENSPDQENDHFQHPTTDFSNGKNLAEFLRIEEIVSSTVSKHLEKLSALLGKGKTDASHDEAVAEKRESNAREFHETSSTRQVLHTQSANKAKQYEQSGAQPFKSRYHYVPTQDRMSVLSQKYLDRYSSNGVGEDDGRGGQTHVASDIRFQHGASNTYIRTLDSSKHCCPQKVDFQGVHDKNFNEGAGLTPPVYRTQVNDPQTGQSAVRTNPENTNPRLSAARANALTDINANIIHNPGFCVEKKPSIQHSKTLRPSHQTEDQNARGIPNDPSSSYHPNHPSTIMQPALLMPIPVIHYASSGVLHAPWIIHNPPAQSLYSGHDGYLMKSENQDPLPSKSECTCNSSSDVDETFFVTRNSETFPEFQKLEKTVCSGVHNDLYERSNYAAKSSVTSSIQCSQCKIHFSPNTPAISRKCMVQGMVQDCGAQFSENNKKSGVLNESQTRFPRNSPEVKVAEHTTPNNRCLRGHSQFSENKPEVRIDTKTTVSNGCLKAQTQFSKSSSEITIAEQRTPHNTCLSSQFSKNSSDVKNVEQATSNNGGQRSETQFSKNNSEIKITEQTTPYNEYLRSLTQVSENSPEIKIAEKTTVNNRCLKNQTSLPGKSLDVKMTGMTTPNNGYLKRETQLSNKTGTQDIANRTNPRGTKGNENSAGKSPANVQLKKRRSLPNLAMIRKMSVGVSGSPDGHAHKPSDFIQRRRALSEGKHGSVNCAEKESHFHVHGNMILNKGSPASSKLKVPNNQTSADGKCSTKRSPTKDIPTLTKSNPSEPRLSSSSQSPRVPSVSPRSTSAHSCSAPFLGNQNTLRRSASATAELIGKYRISGLFCEENTTREKLRMTSRTKDPTRNKPVVVSPHSSMFSPGKEGPVKECRLEMSSKAAATSGSRLQRSASLNDVSMKRRTANGNVSLTKSTSEKIRHLSSSLESLVDKVSDISKNALMRHKQSIEEFDGFLEMSRASSLENLRNRPWKSMDNLLTPGNPVETPSFLFCKHLEAEHLKSFANSHQAWSPSSSIGDNDVFFPAMETNGHVLDMSVQTADPSPVRRVSVSRENSRDCGGNSKKCVNVRQARGSSTSGVCNDSCNKAGKASLILAAETVKDNGDLLSDLTERKKIIGTSGSLMDHCESSRMAVQNTVELSETLDTPGLLTMPGEYEMGTSRISKDPDLAKTPLRVIVTSGTYGKATSPETASRGSTTRTSESFKRSKDLQVSHGLHGTTGGSKTTRILKTSGKLAQYGAVIGASELSKTPELENTPGGNEILGGSGTAEVVDLPERDGIVGSSRTSRTPEVIGLLERDEVMGASKTSRTPEVTDLLERDKVVGASRTSRTPKVTDLLERDEVVGASRTSRTPEVTDLLERDEVVGASRTLRTPEVTDLREIDKVMGASRTSKTPEVTDLLERHEVVGASRTLRTPEITEKNGIVVVSGVSVISRKSGTIRKSEILGTAGDTKVMGLSGTSTVIIKSVMPKTRTSGSTGTPGTAGTPGISVRPDRSGTPGSPGTPGNLGTSVSPGTPGRSENSGRPGTSGHPGRKETTNEDVWATLGASKSLEELSKRKVQNEMQKGSEKKHGVEMANRGKKSSPVRNSLKNYEKEDVRLCRELEKPHEKSGKSDRNGETVMCCEAQVTGREMKYIDRKDSKKETRPGDYNSQWKPGLAFGECEHVPIATKISTASSSLNGTQVNAQFFTQVNNHGLKQHLRSVPDGCHGNNVCSPQSTRPSTAHDITETPRNAGNEKRGRRRGVFEAPEELRARFISQEEVKRLKMCFLSVQRQNNKIVGQDTTSLQNLSPSLQKERLVSTYRPGVLIPGSGIILGSLFL